MKTAYIYILANRWRTLYVGVTTNLEKRLFEHREGVYPGFTSRYALDLLVHVEAHSDIREAFAREKQIESWRRSKKIALIEASNSQWDDLAKDFFPKG